MQPDSTTIDYSNRNGPVTSQSSGSKPQAGAHPSGLRILVADDNVDAASSMAMMLELMGNEVRAVHDGKAAVDAVPSFRPDVILLDIGMPKMDGYETCRLIREQPSGKDAVIVALTGWSQEEYRQRSLRAGFNHFLVKPVEPAALEAVLQGCARKAR